MTRNDLCGLAQFVAVVIAVTLLAFAAIGLMMLK